MAKSVFTNEYEALLQCLVSARNAAGLTQNQLAKKLRKPQSFISKYENGERRLDVVEFMKIARVIGSDPYKLLKEMEGRASEKKSPKEAE